MKRLFFALWPDEAVRRQCCRISEQISNSAIRTVAPKNLHATLLFLGHINSEQETAMTDAAAALSAPSVTLKFNKLSYWKKPGILCLTSREFDQGLTKLAGQLSAIASSHRIKVDDRPFTPHITLARKAQMPVPVEFEPIIWRAEKFCLVESCAGVDGVEYRPIRSWEFQA